jgi:hypothetical protein
MKKNGFDWLYIINITQSLCGLVEQTNTMPKKMFNFCQTLNQI